MKNSFSISELEKVEENLKNERKISMPSSTFGILRRQLAKNLGEDRIQDVLFHFGYEMGAADGVLAKNSNQTLEELVKYGPLLHIKNGHISGVQHDCDVKLNEDGKVISITGQGVWFESYEAREHLKWLGKSDKNVCHTLLGYASGYMSTIFEEKMIAKELTCVGKGDANCSWVIKTQKQWQMEMQDESTFLSQIPIVEELRFTYDQLLEREKLITGILDFQKLLTAEIVNGHDLQHIVDVANEQLRIPIIVKGTKTDSVTYAGLSERRFIQLEEDLSTHIKGDLFDQMIFKKGSKVVSPKPKQIKASKHQRLISPIFVEKELIGWCALILEHREIEEHDKLFLDRLTSTVSILLLNDKTRFESFARMKGNFFEQILTGGFTEKELIKRGAFSNINLSKPYYIAVVQFQGTLLSIEEDYNLQEALHEASFLYFNSKKKNVLVGQREGKVTLFITEDCIEHSIEDELSRFYQHLTEQFGQKQIKIGVSNCHDNINEALQCYQEANIALKLTLKKQVASYLSLGVIGVLMDHNNLEMIKAIAKKELKSLYNTDQQKSVELLKTLYVFLSNGGNLEQTKSDLVLSMSGLRHRIQKIESILEKDLRNPEETYELLLIIKALIISDELHF